MFRDLKGVFVFRDLKGVFVFRDLKGRCLCLGT